MLTKTPLCPILFFMASELDAQPGHLVLARKYRPQKFGDVVQQHTAVRVLSNAIEAGRIGSAYLFFGPRGVGKTTLARILAKRVNCLNPQGVEPCDACENCLAILNNTALDILEIDAASQRKIEHVRELRENVQFPPMHAKRKVYIIDEVHMLTTEAFNALLKTLEEPPPHVLFVLATTELNKIPETILSRCQVFTFRKVQLKIIQEYLKELCRREKIDAEDEALFWVARRGDGSVRDSLSFLEQAITFSGRKVTSAAVKELVGALPLDLFIGLTSALLNPESKDEAVVQPVEELFAV
ncbi:MAG: DNA polymerase III subunit gamma/tau, partial [Spirochaetia bacterium]|nr:DNA polymerase III subunit gamma/tau [Spirochaetia bacterium]